MDDVRSSEAFRLFWSARSEKQERKRNQQERCHYKDLAGQKFGRLTALEATKERSAGGNVIWLCRCDCGKTVKVRSCNLVRGVTTHCGCAGKTGGKTRFDDLTGRRFGRLTVVEKLPERAKRGSVIWRCVCDCGNEVKVSQGELVSGNTGSCGCRKKETYKEACEAQQLVEGTYIQILENRKRRSDNLSGHVGVSLDAKTGRYSASIALCGKRYYLGRFDTIEEAVKIRDRASDVLHGGFLKAYHEWESTSEEYRSAHPFSYPLPTRQELLSSVM